VKNGKRNIKIKSRKGNPTFLQIFAKKVYTCRKLCGIFSTSRGKPSLMTNKGEI